VATAALQSKPPPPPTTCTALTMTFIQLLLLTAQVHIVQLARHTKGSLFTAPYASFERRPRGSLRKSSVAFLACIESKLSIKRDLVQALLQCGHCHAFIDCANSMAIRHATTTTRRLDDSSSSSLLDSGLTHSTLSIDFSIRYHKTQSTECRNKNKQHSM